MRSVLQVKHNYITERSWDQNLVTITKEVESSPWHDIYCDTKEVQFAFIKQQLQSECEKVQKKVLQVCFNHSLVVPAYWFFFMSDHNLFSVLIS